MISTMTKKAKLPDDLKHSKCKRGKLVKQGVSLQPVHIIHLEATSDKEAATMAIYTSCRVKEDFLKYSGGNTELAIVHVCLFKLIQDKCNFSKDQEIAQLMLNSLQIEYNALDMCASMLGKKLKQDFDEALKEVKGNIDTTKI